MKPLCIFHSADGKTHCADGFAAALVVHQAFMNDGGCDFHPGVYQQPPPDVTGRDVYIVDFSYRRPVMEEMARQAKSITVIDHHDTAEQELRPLLDAGVVRGEFNNGQCGSMLTWTWFNESGPPPLLNYIQDRDLWERKLPMTDEVTFALRSYPQTFEVWRDLWYGSGVERLKAEGVAIHRYYRTVIESLKANARVEPVGGLNVPTVNCPYMFASEVAGEIADKYSFGACWWQNADGSRTYSLRSSGEFHVGNFAAQFGGGGHAGAAGFTVR